MKKIVKIFLFFRDNTHILSISFSTVSLFLLLEEKYVFACTIAIVWLLILDTLTNSMAKSIMTMLQNEIELFVKMEKRINYLMQREAQRKAQNGPV